MDWEDIGNRIEAWLRRKFSSDQRGEFQRGGKLVEAGSMGKIKSGLFYVGCTLMAIFVLFNLLVDYIPPSEYGVREVRWSIGPLTGPKGVRNEKLETGYYVVYPILMTLHRLPRHPVVLDYHSTTKGGEKYKSSRIKTYPQQRIQTSDGFYTENDLSIMARTVDPYKTLINAGPNEAFITNGLLLKADNALKASLGLMDTEQYYQWPLLRYLLANGNKKDFSEYFKTYKDLYDKKVADATKEKPFPSDEKRRMEILLKILARGSKEDISNRALLNQELLGTMGVETVFSAVRYFHFPKDITENIRAKVLQVQEYELNTSLTNYQMAQAQLADVEEKGQQGMKNLESVGQQYYDKKTGDKNKYVRVTTSEGDKLENLATAYRDQKERDVLEIPGSANWVSRKVADDALQNTGLIVTTPEAFKAYLSDWGK